MGFQALGIDGAWVHEPTVWPDDRGAFLEWFRVDGLAAATGRPFSVAQANHSVSRRGVLRGLHFSDVPPGQAKYVYCSRGCVLDVVLDVRVGSPTFGQHATVTLDDEARRAVFLAEGLAHGFCVLSEVADVTYLTSTTYDPATDRGIDPLDADVGIPWPADIAHLLSAKDRAAPSLADALAAGILPRYEDCAAPGAGQPSG